MKFAIALSILLQIFASSAMAWGHRGHHTICEAAVYLVRNPELKTFLRRRSHWMGHLCNVPDTYWRDIKEARTYGDPAHFIDPEKFGLKLTDVPIDFLALEKRYDGKTIKYDGEDIKVESVGIELGSLWWRADQFVRRSTDFAHQASKQEPVEKGERQNYENPYNRAVFQMVVNMGLLGHFVGDASVPYHGTADYDGWQVGHGGIHSYYEDEVVAELAPDLVAVVVAKAKALRKLDFMLDGDALARMKALSIAAYKDRAAIEKIDAVKKPSEKKQVDGKLVKVPAERRPAADLAKAFKPWIVQEMAYSAWLLADFWEQIYHDGDSPKLAAYGSYEFPFKPEFVPPDYIGGKK